MSGEDGSFQRFAYDFANALCHKQYGNAAALLSLEQNLDAETLQQKFEQMISYGDDLNNIECELFEESMTEWPAKTENDVGWQYVSIMGDGFSEAVAVTVCRDSLGEFKIRVIEWGRP